MTYKKRLMDGIEKNKGNEIKYDEYEEFLQQIGYLKEKGQDFKIDIGDVDEEISKIAGPQLVVPIMNARYALNAANARWMSLYDSLYGTDAIEESEDMLLKDMTLKEVNLLLNMEESFLISIFL